MVPLPPRGSLGWPFACLHLFRTLRSHRSPTQAMPEKGRYSGLSMMY